MSNGIKIVLAVLGLLALLVVGVLVLGEVAWDQIVPRVSK